MPPFQVRVIAPDLVIALLTQTSDGPQSGWRAGASPR